MPISRSSVEGHPQQQQIIDGLLAQVSLRKIAAQLDPPISYKAIERYARKVVRPTLARAAEVSQAVRDVMRPTVSRSAPPALSQVVTHDGNASQSLQVAPNRDITDTTITPESVTSAILGADSITSTGSSPAIIESRAGRIKVLAERQSLLHKAALSELAEPGDTLRRAPRLLGTLLSESRAHEDQIAVELGQRVDASGPQVAIQIVYPSAPGATGRHDMPTVNIGLPKR